MLRRAPDGRFEPYEDFTGARRRAMADPRNLVNGGALRGVRSRRDERPDLAALRRPASSPTSTAASIEVEPPKSRLYGGDDPRSTASSPANRKIQYLFVAAPRHVWIIPPQTLTTELKSYGVRTVDVNADEDVFIPGYEYHFLDELEDPSSPAQPDSRGFRRERPTPRSTRLAPTRRPGSRSSR